MKKRFWTISSLALVAALLLNGSALAQQGSAPVRTRPNEAATRRTPASASERAGAAASGRKASTADVKDDFGEALKVIQENYVDGDRLDYNAVYKSSINGMLRSLDPHSNYFDAKEFEEFANEQRSQYFGIGALIGDLRYGDEVNTYFRATFQNSPAARAGIRFGDRILEVDGVSMRGKPYPEVREKLRGPRGTIVRVKVERAAEGRVETLEITRGAVPQPSIPESYMLRPGVGYIAMTGGFNTTTVDEFAVALEELHRQEMKLLVLDLRGNGGGLLVQALSVANAFLKRGQLLLTQKGRIRNSSQTFIAENDRPDTIPLVVLINRGTASASEILAGALQDHDRAVIVGETSFGKGLVQLPYNLEEGTALLLTIAKYYTPSGRLIQRDYSGGDLYDYFTGGGLGQNERQSSASPTGPASRTDTGRIVYGGGGISPDEPVKPAVVSAAQQRLLDPVFGFAVEVAAGRVKGFDAYAVERPIIYGRDLKPADFPITDALFQAFKNYVAGKPLYKLTPAQIERHRAFVERQLRYELVTAAYGMTTAAQVFNLDDPQINRAIDALPRARELARAAAARPAPQP